MAIPIESANKAMNKANWGMWGLSAGGFITGSVGKAVSAVTFVGSGLLNASWELKGEPAMEAKSNPCTNCTKQYGTPRGNGLGYGQIIKKTGG